MKQYTVRFAHLEMPSARVVGSVIRRGDVIGRMGNTGSSTAPHLHYDVVEGYKTLPYRLKDIVFNRDTIRQLALFNDDELFDFEIVTTAYFGDHTYLDKDGKWKMHPAMDVVPKNRHIEPDRNFDFFWNRSSDGVLLYKGFNSGYGDHIMVGYEA